MSRQRQPVRNVVPRNTRFELAILQWCAAHLRMPVLLLNRTRCDEALHRCVCLHVQITTDDLALIWADVKDVLLFNVPAGSGFTAGLLGGLGASPVTATAGGAAAGKAFDGQAFVSALAYSPRGAVR